MLTEPSVPCYDIGEKLFPKTQIAIFTRTVNLALRLFVMNCKMKERGYRNFRATYQVMTDPNLDL